MASKEHEKSAHCGFGVIFKKSAAIRHYTRENDFLHIDTLVEWKGAKVNFQSMRRFCQSQLSLQLTWNTY